MDSESQVNNSISKNVLSYNEMYLSQRKEDQQNCSINDWSELFRKCLLREDSFYAFSEDFKNVNSLQNGKEHRG